MIIEKLGGSFKIKNNKSKINQNSFNSSPHHGQKLNEPESGLTVEI
jgi:hypothetical protein